MKLKKILLCLMVGMIALSCFSTNSSAYYSKKDKKETSITFKERENLVSINSFTGNWWSVKICDNSFLDKMEVGKEYTLSYIMIMNQKHEDKLNMNYTKGLAFFSPVLGKALEIHEGDTSKYFYYEQMQNGEKVYCKVTFTATSEFLNKSNNYQLYGYTEQYYNSSNELKWDEANGGYPDLASNMTFQNIQIYENK